MPALRFVDLNKRQRKMLLDRKTYSTDVLAARFGVCRRSIVRYRELLRDEQQEVGNSDVQLQGSTP